MTDNIDIMTFKTILLSKLLLGQFSIHICIYTQSMNWLKPIQIDLVAADS